MAFHFKNPIRFFLSGAVCFFFLALGVQRTEAVSYYSNRVGNSKPVRLRVQKSVKPHSLSKLGYKHTNPWGRATAAKIYRLPAKKNTASFRNQRR